LLGWAPDELVGTSGFEYVHPEDREALADALSRLAAGRVSQSTVRYRFRHADGSWRWIGSVLATAPPAVDGAFVVDSRDVTERMLVDHHVQVLDRVFRHNFRNALNVVVGHADLLAETLDGEPARAAPMVADRRRELDSLADTARRIGQYARPDRPNASRSVGSSTAWPAGAS
jgi:signal transduction histidine kinase